MSKSINSRWRPFEEAREFVRGLGLKNTDEWEEYAHSDRLPLDIPVTPWTVYKGKGWAGFYDWLGNEPRPWRPFSEAREFVRALGLASGTEWREYTKSGRKPDDLPATPNNVYKDEWQGMGDWLGTHRIANQDRKFRPFEEARQFVQRLGLKNDAEWKVWAKSGRRPSDIPSSPNETYEDDWQGLDDWLGTGARAPKSGWRPFEQAREFARGLGLKNRGEWREYVKHDDKPDDIPAAPHISYNEEWIHYADWLGTNHIHYSNREYLSFEEARKYVRGLGLRSIEEWREYYKSDMRPDNIPSNPALVYKNEGWRGIPDFLGYTPNAWNRSTLLALLEDLRPQLPYPEERELYAILQQGGAMPALVRKFGKGSPLAVLKDLKEHDGRGIEETLEEVEEDEPLDAEVEDESLDTIDTDTPEVIEKDTPEPNLPTLVTGGALRAVDNLATPPGGLDDETAEYLIANRVAALWEAAINGREEEIPAALAGDGGHYYQLIRERFETERAEVAALPIPEG